MGPQDARQRLESAFARLPRPLQEHIQRVRQEAGTLARRFGLDEERVDLAALAHDMARATPVRDLRRLARSYRLSVSPVDDGLPVLLHGPVGAAWLRRRLHLHDPEIAAAVRWHSTAAPGLSPLGKVIFLADKLDPAKEGRYPFMERVRRLARNDLDAAVLAFLEHELQRLLHDRQLIHPASVEARNELLAHRRAGNPDGERPMPASP